MVCVLLPVELPEWCELYEGVNWIEWGMYPLGDQAISAQEIVLNIPIAPSRDDQITQGRLHEQAQDKLVRELAEGKIAALGFYYARDDEATPIDGDNPDSGSDLKIERRKIPIPPAVWSTRRVDWRQGELRVAGGYYREIIISTQDLLRSFREQAGKKSLVEKRGEFFVCEDDRKASLKDVGGRPLKYDWEKFWREVVLIANTLDGLPDKPADLVTEMMEWCENNFDPKIGESSVRRRVASLYAQISQRKKSV